MICTPTIKTAIAATFWWNLPRIWPWTKLLWLLWRCRGSIASLWWRRPKNQSTNGGIPLGCSYLGVRNNPISWRLSTRGSRRHLSFFVSTMCYNAVLLG
jgi:hypothetical protein